MDILKIDIGQLIMLWQASDGNPELKQQIEIEFQNRIATNSNFSLEYCFQICIIEKHAITIYFIPTSEAYKRYGSDLTIDMLLSDEETQNLMKSYSAKTQTTGIVKGKVLVTGNLTKEQIAQAASIGFHTGDISEMLVV